MKYAEPQPMTTWAMTETAKRLLSSDRIAIEPHNVAWDMTRDFTGGYPAVQFDNQGRPTFGRWLHNAELFVPNA